MKTEDVGKKMKKKGKGEKEKGEKWHKNDLKTAWKCIFKGWKLKNFRKGGSTNPPTTPLAAGRGFAPPVADLVVGCGCTISAGSPRLYLRLKIWGPNRKSFVIRQNQWRRVFPSEPQLIMPRTSGRSATESLTNGSYESVTTIGDLILCSISNYFI